LIFFCREGQQAAAQSFTFFDFSSEFEMKEYVSLDDRSRGLRPYLFGTPFSRLLYAAWGLLDFYAVRELKSRTARTGTRRHETMSRKALT
ncbi:MAG: hypothetical protein NTV84_10785, partial [Methanoregula sp.]|nr:hypothetical protein [Methanoregula sp.]